MNSFLTSLLPSSIHSFLSSFVLSAIHSFLFVFLSSVPRSSFWHLLCSVAANTASSQRQVPGSSGAPTPSLLTPCPENSSQGAGPHPMGQGMAARAAASSPPFWVYSQWGRPLSGRCPLTMTPALIPTHLVFPPNLKVTVMTSSFPGISSLGPPAGS